jgi:sulfatase maturation enzyme AslB (radical SAM superfamily)
VRHLLLHAVARAYLRKPDLADFLISRYPDLRSLWAAARNELAFRLGADRLPVLTTLNVELTSRCNAACSYCDVNRDLGRPNQDLPLSALVHLLERTPSLQTLLPFQWGEPLLYGPLDEALAAATARRVRSYLTTNGLLLDGARFRRLAQAGLARLTVSLDGAPATHRERRGYEQERALAGLAEARAVQQRERLATRLDVSMVADRSVAHELPAFRARLAPLCDRVQFIPRLQASARAAACREPSRGLLVVLSDGSVTTCCADVRGELALGRIEELLDPSAEAGAASRLYAGARWRALRRAHREGRFPGPCATCGECEVSGVSSRFL